MQMEFNDSYYDSLLDEPTDSQEEVVVEPEHDPADDEPLIPDQESDTGDGNDPGAEGGGNDPEEDVLTSYLKSRGISDPTKIKFETEEGGEEEKDWNFLSKE